MPVSSAPRRTLPRLSGEPASLESPHMPALSQRPTPHITGWFPESVATLWPIMGVVAGVGGRMGGWGGGQAADVAGAGGHCLPAWPSSGGAADRGVDGPGSVDGVAGAAAEHLQLAAAVPGAERAHRGG